MALLSVANLVFHIGDHTLLDGVNLSLAAGEHVGMVGRNGCGKSTLLKMIARARGGSTPGSPPPNDHPGASEKLPGADSGQIQLARGATAGYLEQDHHFDPRHTLRQEAGMAFAELARLHAQLDKTAHDMAEADGDALDKLMRRYEQLEEKMQVAGGYAVDHKIDEILHGLGLTDDFFDVPVGELSGGQKGRLALAKLLLSEPDILLLDEPTNHLDIAGRQWLEEFLRQFPGSVIIISHDRWLLDRVVTRIYELERGRLIEYPGNYNKYVELRKERFLDQKRAFDKQQTKIKQEQSFIDRYRAGQRSKQAQGREKRLDRYKESQQLEAPPELETMSLSFGAKTRSGDNVIQAEGLGVTYDDNQLFKDFVLTIHRGDRIGVIGPNGAGKTTLVRCLLGEQPATAGRTKLGAQVEVGYYRQDHGHMDPSRTVVEYLRTVVADGLEQSARDLAGAFLFSGREQDKPLSVLSGGERARAALAALMSQGPNLLVLDEPTNHLDIPSAERLEEALRQYVTVQKSYSTKGPTVSEGTLILITHDRMLLDHLVDQLIIFDGNGHAKHFLGTYSDYLASLTPSPPAPGSVPRAHGSGPGSTPGKNSRETGGTASKSSRTSKQSGQGGTSKTTAKPPVKQNKALASLAQDKLEARIVQIESDLAGLDAQLADPDIYRDADKVRQLQTRRNQLQAKLEPLEAEWATRA